MFENAPVDNKGNFKYVEYVHTLKHGAQEEIASG